MPSIYTWLAKLKRAYHRWCLTNAIAHYGFKIVAYHASTNSYTVKSERTSFKYHAYVDSRGKIIFEGISHVDE